MINAGSVSLPSHVLTKGTAGIINPPERHSSPIHITCDKCGHQAELILSADRKSKPINWYASCQSTVF